jgi:outer membrane protein assembly factor BamB
MWTSPWPSNSEGQACASQPVVIGPDSLMFGKGYALGSKGIKLECCVPPDSPAALEFQSWSVKDLWSNPKLMKTKFTSAIHCQGLLYGLSDGVLECIDPTNGTRMWRGKRYGQGQMLIVNEHVLVSAEDGRVALVTTQPDGEWEPGKVVVEMPVLEGVTWNIPAVAGRYILVRNSEQAACISTE